MKYGISAFNTIPIRKEPDERAEMVSQLLFGECYEIIDSTEKFYLITSSFDKYKGWIDNKMHTAISNEFYIKMENESHVQTSLLTCIEKDSKPIIISVGSTLPCYDPDKETIRIEDDTFIIKWSFKPYNIKNFDQIAETAELFLNTPYLWGGRSFFGCDCSGFTQTVYKLHNIRLNRDANQQALQGELISDIEHARAGDLAFFKSETGKITHVGIILPENKIIHCSGYVRIDNVDKKGIFDNTNKHYTHSLSSVKRII